MKNSRSNNILKKSIDIIYDRNSEKAKEYGPFDESMASAAIIATELTGKKITTEDFYKCMMALKLARLKYSNKEDTFLDFVAYSAALQKRIVDNQPVPVNSHLTKAEAEKIESYNSNTDDHAPDAILYASTKLNKTYPNDNSCEFDGNHANN